MSSRRTPIPKPGDSQRPTVERLDDASPVDWESAPEPVLSSPPVLGEIDPGLELDPMELPIEFSARYAIELLTALIPLHTDMRVPPAQRFYSKVCLQNCRVTRSGQVYLMPRSMALLQPSGLRAPELSRGLGDQQSDLFAVGALLMGLIGQYASARGATGDALLERLSAVAALGASSDPERRWGSASEFASELQRAAGPRLAAREALGVYALDRALRFALPALPESTTVSFAPSGEWVDSRGPMVLSQPCNTPEEPILFLNVSDVKLIEKRPKWRLLAAGALALAAGVGGWLLLPGAPFGLSGNTAARSNALEAPAPKVSLPLVLDPSQAKERATGAAEIPKAPLENKPSAANSDTARSGLDKGDATETQRGAESARTENVKAKRAAISKATVHNVNKTVTPLSAPAASANTAAKGVDPNKRPKKKSAVYEPEGI